MKNRRTRSLLEVEMGWVRVKSEVQAIGEEVETLRVAVRKSLPPQAEVHSPRCTHLITSLSSSIRTELSYSSSLHLENEALKRKLKRLASVPGKVEDEKKRYEGLAVAYDKSRKAVMQQKEEIQRLRGELGRYFPRKI